MLRKLVEVRVSGFVFRQDSPVAPFQHLEIRYCSVVSHGRYDLSVVPIGFATVSNAGLGEIADSILRTMLIAFAGVALVLAGMYHLERDAPSLGAVTVIPIALVIGLVFGGMMLFDVPLTFITAFLASITVGLGIDYSIHVSDRFTQELDRGKDPVDALSETVVGTGGALFGSALTSGVSFVTLLLHPSPMFQSFGFIVVIALLLSFAVSVFVFPSLLLLWANWGGISDNN
jgi:predicted RND superfamily exporter protein